MRNRIVAIVVVTAVGLAGACSSDDDGGDQAATTTSTTTPAGAPSTDPAGGSGPDADRLRSVVETLADDAMEGRDNQTPGSTAAQDFLIEQLGEITEPLEAGASGPDAYRHEFAEGTNLLGLIPGGDRAEEYLVIGGHYDHLGRDCPSDTPGDDVCNGAGDNAAGVAAVLEVARALAGADEPPERSVIVALWDAEEDGLLGAGAYVADPPVPLADTVAYLNWDIQGVNLLPSLATTTVMVGAETGGPNLTAAAREATSAGDLQTLELSLLFGQGRSDHAVFASAEVPTVFFTDANNACYHTSQDDTAHLDFAKLEQQVRTGTALAQDLVATDDVPEFDPGAPPASFEDAVSMQAVVSSAEPDFGRFDADGQATIEQFLTDLDAMVEAGEAAFDDDAVETLLGGSVDVVELLTEGSCEGFLD